MAKNKLNLKLYKYVSCFHLVEQARNISYWQQLCFVKNSELFNVFGTTATASPAELLSVMLVLLVDA